jgi:hypothetical protein
MGIIELAAQKAGLTREILTANEEKIVKIYDFLRKEKEAPEVMTCECTVEPNEQIYNPNVQEVNKARVYSLSDIQAMLTLT